MANTKSRRKANKVYSQYQEAKSKYESFHDTMERIERLTLMSPDEIQQDGTRSRVADPIMYGQMMDEVSYFASNKPKGTYAPAEYGDMFKSKILNANFQFDWRKDRMEMKMPKLLKMKKILGLAYARNTYKVEKQKKHFKAVKTNGDIKEVNKECTIHDGPSCEVLNFYRVYPQSDAFSWDDMEYIFVEDWVTIEDLENKKDKGGEYKNLRKLKDKIKEIREDKRLTSNAAEQERDTLKDLLQLDKDTGKFKMITKYTKTRWTSVAGNIVVRDVDNPYAHGELPIIPMYDDVWYDNVIAPSEFYFIERLQRAANKLLNMRFDDVESIMGGMIRLSPEVDRTIFRMGKFKVFEGDEGDIEYIQKPDATGGTFINAWGSIKDGIKTATAVQDFSSQLNPVNPSSELATGLRQQGDRTERRMQYKSMFVDDFIKRLANQWLSLTRQFAPTKKIIRIAGRDLVGYFKEHTMTQLGSNREPMSLQDAIKNGQGREMEALGLAIERGEGEYEPKFRFAEGENFGWIRLTAQDFQGNYDFIPATKSTVSVDKARRRVEVSGFLETLMAVIELYKGGFLREKSLYDIAEVFDLSGADSWFNMSNLKNVVSSQQAGFTGLAGGAPGQRGTSATPRDIASKIADQQVNPSPTSPTRGFPVRGSNLAREESKFRQPMQ